ncbi:unnamed protein product [Owenia fusiformis]|uniref:C2H2-type domain-containing protein n=1 Tax=Owenia fusiformis TaxID=6347 RepID=A0A8S4PHA5_OWEFU|nr:unnamed protein product [Owenia fusiformis]
MCCTFIIVYFFNFIFAVNEGQGICVTYRLTSVTQVADVNTDFTNYSEVTSLDAPPEENDTNGTDNNGDDPTDYSGASSDYANDNTCDKSGAHTNDHSTLSQNHGLATWTCGKCPKTFQTRSGLLRHNRKHTNIYPYSCVECSKGFNSKVKLEDHNRILHGARRFFCPCCSKTICSNYGKKQHVDLHSSEVFACPQCDKKFNARHYLQRHIITHSVIHTCDICFKKYSTKAHLKDHMRTHNSVFFKCTKDDCSFQTNYKTSLKRHLATHDNRE